jgi:4-carboxymuconolactone decarboxylase
MRSSLAILVLICVSSLHGQTQGIDPHSLNRLPVIQREQLDETGKSVYDAVAGGAGKTISPTGPVNLHLYTLGAAESLRQLNEYLRRPESPLGTALPELAILVAAREEDSQYEWSAHEPAALKAGISQAAIDAVKFNRPLTGLGDKEATIISLGRQIMRDHKLDSATWSRSIALFGREGTVELITVMGNYVLNALLLNAVDQQLPPDRKPLLPAR